MRYIILAALVLFIIFAFASNAHAGFYASWSTQPIRTTFSQAKPAFTGAASAQFTFGQVKPVQWSAQPMGSINMNFQTKRAEPQGTLGTTGGSASWNMRQISPKWYLGSGSISLGINKQLISGGAKFTAQPTVNVQGAGFRAIKTGPSYLRIRAQPGRFVYSYNALNDP